MLPGEEVRGVRVLGVDPGLTRCGVGVVEGVPGRPCALVSFEAVTTAAGDDLARRLLHLDRQLTGLIATHQPGSVAVDRVFSQHNVRTVMGHGGNSYAAMIEQFRKPSGRRP